MGHWKAYPLRRKIDHGSVKNWRSAEYWLGFSVWLYNTGPVLAVIIGARFYLNLYLTTLTMQVKKMINCIINKKN